MATDWHIQRLEQGYEPAFINMFVVRGHFVVGADGSRSRVELKYGATAILNTPSFEAEDTSEISRRTGRSVSVRELSIPERASNGYERNQPSGQK